MLYYIAVKEWGVDKKEYIKFSEKKKKSRLKLFHVVIGGDS